MPGLEHLAIIKALDTAAKDAEGLIRGLFGPAFEGAAMLTDNIRLRRFKNQIKIFKKAEKLLKKNKINPSKLNLKVLAPLIEFTALEEDENLQELWANLIKNIVSKPISLMMQQNAIDILRKLSNEEVRVLNLVYESAIQQRILMAEKLNRGTSQDKPITPEHLTIHQFSFSINRITEDLEQDRAVVVLSIDALFALNLVRYTVDGVAFDSRDFKGLFFEDGSNPLSVGITDTDSVRLTDLGFEFVRICQ